MSTRSVWRNGILTFYDDSTHERVLPVAPLVYVDDFFRGKTVIPAAASEEAGVDWSKKIVGAAPPTVAGVADSANGVVACALTSDSQEQEALLTWSDERNFSLEQGCVFEARVKVAVLPTLVAEAVFGLCGDYVKGPDNVTHSVFFTADGSGEVFCEMDDAATDRSTTSGVTVLATEWHTYRIDATDVSDVKFYIDGVGVATGTTFAYAATGSDAILQPYLGCYKASGAGVGTLYVDYVRIWQKRS